MRTESIRARREQQRNELAAARRAAARALGTSGGGTRPGSDGLAIWSQLAAARPALAEWASYFALLEGQRRLSERQTDDLLRDLGLFLDLAGQKLARLRPERLSHG